MHRPSSAPARARIFLGTFGLAAGLALVLTASGCKELGARTLVQEGNALYEDQEYEKAVLKYEEALKKKPDLEVIHHNLGLAYSRMFRPGVDTPENKALVAKAAEQFQWWLERNPGDTKIRKFLLNMWVEAEEYKPVLDYFLGEHQKDPQNREFVQKVANIHLMMGDWHSSVDWYYKDVALAPDTPAKVAAYQTITQLAFGRLWTPNARQKTFGQERLELVEVGLKAAQEGLALDDKQLTLTSYSHQLWNQRAVAQGPYWAAAIDRAEGQVFEQRVSVLKEEAKKNQPPAPPAGTPGTGS
jgi:tetratricopeptide (TPR) repeat protein